MFIYYLISNRAGGGRSYSSLHQLFRSSPLSPRQTGSDISLALIGPRPLDGGSRVRLARQNGLFPAVTRRRVPSYLGLGLEGPPAERLPPPTPPKLHRPGNPLQTNTTKATSVDSRRDRPRLQVRPLCPAPLPHSKPHNFI